MTRGAEQLAPWDGSPIPLDAKTSQWFQGRIAAWLQQIENRTRRLVIDAGDPMWGLPWNTETVDSVPAWEKFMRQVPNGAVVALTTPGFLVRKTDAPLLSGRWGIRLVTMRLPFPDGNPESVCRFLWGGSTSGGRLAFIESCNACQLSGVYLDCDTLAGVDHGLVVDGTGIGGIGSSCTFQDLKIRRLRASPNFVAIQVSHPNGENNEYHTFKNLSLNGGTPAGGETAESQGVGIYIAQAPNAKKIRILSTEGSTTIDNFETGIWHMGGELQTESLSFGRCGQNYLLDTIVGSCTLGGDDTEQSRRHLVIRNSGGAVTLAPSRFDNSRTLPGDGFIVIDNSNTHLEFMHHHVDHLPPAGAQFFAGVNNPRARLSMKGVDFIFGTTMAQLGLSEAFAYGEVRDCSGIVDAPGPDFTWVRDVGPKSFARSIRQRTVNVQGGGTDSVELVAESGDGSPYVARQTVVETLGSDTEVILNRRIIRATRAQKNTYVVDETIGPTWSGGMEHPSAIILDRYLQPPLGPEAGVMEELCLEESLDLHSSGVAKRYTRLRTDADLDIRGAIAQGIIEGLPNADRLAPGQAQPYIAGDGSLCVMRRDLAGKLWTFTLGTPRPV